MQDHPITLFRLKFDLLPVSHLALVANLGWIFSIVAAVECTHELCKYAPNKLFLRIMIAIFQFLDVAAKITIPAILHVKMQVMAGLQVFSMAILDNVGVTQRFENA
jgi:hypothetical protein